MKISQTLYAVGCLEIGSLFSLVSKLCAYGLADFYTTILIPSLTKRVV